MDMRMVVLLRERVNGDSWLAPSVIPLSALGEFRAVVHALPLPWA
jgi:hypothetical protein